MKQLAKYFIAWETITSTNCLTPENDAYRDPNICMLFYTHTSSHSSFLIFAGGGSSSSSSFKTTVIWGCCTGKGPFSDVTSAYRDQHHFAFAIAMQWHRQVWTQHTKSEGEHTWHVYILKFDIYTYHKNYHIINTIKQQNAQMTPM